MIRLEPVSSRRLVAGQLIWFLVWCCVTGFGIYLKPSPTGHGTHMELGLPPCPSVLLFNRPCPGCGLTTSWTATIHGDLPTAFHAHPFGPILYLMFTFTALYAIYYWWRKIYVNTESRRFNRTLGAVVIAFFLFGAVRFAMSPSYGDSGASAKLAKR